MMMINRKMIIMMMIMMMMVMMPKNVPDIPRAILVMFREASFAHLSIFW